MNIGKIYIRPTHLITYRTFGAEYYSKLRKRMIENYNNKKKRVFVQKEPKMTFTNYGSFQNIDKIKWSPATQVEEEIKILKKPVVEMKPVRKPVSSDDEWVDVKKTL